jgi:hypothetical protein
MGLFDFSTVFQKSLQYLASVETDQVIKNAFASSGVCVFEVIYLGGSGGVRSFASARLRQSMEFGVEPQKRFRIVIIESKHRNQRHRARASVVFDDSFDVKRAIIKPPASVKQSDNQIGKGELG